MYSCVLDEYLSLKLRDTSDRWLQTLGMKLMWASKRVLWENPIPRSLASVFYSAWGRAVKSTSTFGLGWRHTISRMYAICLSQVQSQVSRSNGTLLFSVTNELKASSVKQDGTHQCYFSEPSSVQPQQPQLQVATKLSSSVFTLYTPCVTCSAFKNLIDWIVWHLTYLSFSCQGGNVLWDGT